MISGVVPRIVLRVTVSFKDGFVGSCRHPARYSRKDWRLPIPQRSNGAAAQQKSTDSGGMGVPYYRMTPLGSCAPTPALACASTGERAPSAELGMRLSHGLAALRQAIWLSTQTSSSTQVRVPGQGSRLGDRRSPAPPLPVQPPMGIGSPGSEQPHSQDDEPTGPL